MKYILSVCIGLFLCIPNAAFAENCKTGEPFSYESPYNIENCPEDIQNWMDRASTCVYFEGEEPYDAERKAEIDGVLNENKCSYIGCDRQELWGQYEGDVIYTRVISDYEELLYGEAGVACDVAQELPPQDAEKAADPNVEGAVKGLFDSIFK